MDGIYMNVVCLPPKRRILTTPDVRSLNSGVPLGNPEKPYNFKTAPSESPRQQKNENWSQGHPKSSKLDPGMIPNPISAKDDFCNTSLAKCLFLQFQTPKFRPRNHQKKQPVNRSGKSSVFCLKITKKLSKWVP